MGAGIDAGDRVPLKKDHVAAVLLTRRMPEPIEADIIECGRRGKRGDVTTDIGVAVGAHDHDHGVPANVVANPDFNGGIARIPRLPIERDGVDIFGGGAVRDVDPLLARLGNHLLDQEVGTLGAFLVDHAGQRVMPFTGLLRIGVVGVVDFGRLGVFG